MPVEQCPHAWPAAYIGDVGGWEARILSWLNQRVHVRKRMQLRRAVTVGAALAMGAGVGCGGRLQVTRINSDQAKPNNVWVFFTVERGEEPIAGLDAEDFKIYEDDQLVSAFESKQLILNPDVAAVMYTLLLI